jgi:hypothetical protein
VSRLYESLQRANAGWLAVEVAAAAGEGDGHTERARLSEFPGELSPGSPTGNPSAHVASPEATPAVPRDPAPIPGFLRSEDTRSLEGLIRDLGRDEQQAPAGSRRERQRPR